MTLTPREKLTPQSDITASSQFGVNGVVNLNVPEVDINQGIDNFTLNFVDTNTQLTSACTAISENRFSISGRGGFPASPIQPRQRRNYLARFPQC
ncbi:MAG: S-layer family protein [Calothrix sp. C42_A2020_038]|nr:S-layer family protein [Calothrix sp. C42_A2020_038]